MAPHPIFQRYYFSPGLPSHKEENPVRWAVPSAEAEVQDQLTAAHEVVVDAEAGQCFSYEFQFISHDGFAILRTEAFRAASYPRPEHSERLNIPP